MSQIEITVLKQGTPSKKVLSCSLFKMKSAYRDFSKYENHFKNFLERSKKLKGFEVRAYGDDTTKDILLKLSEKYDNASVYHYNCPEFKEGDGHIGIFGMYPRFLPLFEDGLEVVWVSDIDITDSFLDPQLLNVMKRNNADVFISSGLCSQRSPWQRVKYPIVAHKFITFQTFPKQLLTRYLNKLLKGELDDLVSAINEFNIRYRTPSKVPYGIDEGFLNSLLYNYIKKKDLTVLIYKDYFTVNNFFTYKIKDYPIEHTNFLLRYYRTQDPKMFAKAKQIFMENIPKLVDQQPCMQDFLDHADELKTSFIRKILIPSSNL